MLAPQSLALYSKGTGMNNFEFSKKRKEEYTSIFLLWSKEISFTKNLKFLLIELFFSLQITELLVDTSSLELKRNGPTKLSEAGKSESGMVAGLSMFIPATLMTKFFERQIAEMIYFKYYRYYKLIKEANKELSSSAYNALNDESNSTFFTLNKNMAHQLVPYRGKMKFLWTILETIATVVTWVSTNSLEITLLVTGFCEFLRRFRI
ncbi:MAG: hypothetical protein ACI8R0_003179 [Alteromonadales bacterium]|jgi:hypothetical protein|nr:hypothetical protein [Leeuwenhoekiella sp.]|tara:strand:+ start:469 stop:1089 length:621 start_codon:yes stop_codon:yes gene_type:complete